MQKLVILIILLFGCAQAPIKHESKTQVLQNYKVLFNQALQNFSKCWRLPFDSQFKQEMTEYNINTAVKGLIQGVYVPGNSINYSNIYAREYKSIKEAEVFIRKAGKSILIVKLKSVAPNKSEISISGESPSLDKKADTNKILGLITKKGVCTDDD